MLECVTLRRKCNEPFPAKEKRILNYEFLYLLFAIFNWLLKIQWWLLISALKCWVWDRHLQSTSWKLNVVRQSSIHCSPGDDTQVRIQYPSSLGREGPYIISQGLLARGTVCCIYKTWKSFAVRSNALGECDSLHCLWPIPNLSLEIFISVWN